MKLKRHELQGGHGYPSPFGPAVCVRDAAELLRPIREYHAGQVQRYAQLLEEAERAGAKDVIKRVRKLHAMHLGFVQQLNEFFDDEPA